jgi:hypothetical protein
MGGVNTSPDGLPYQLLADLVLTLHGAIIKTSSPDSSSSSSAISLLALVNTCGSGCCTSAP